MLTGTFTPSPDAKKLSAAPHLNNPSTPVIARFSNSTGIPQIPDTNPDANPCGLAVRFNLGEHVHTDIIVHSTPFFPTRTGEEFLEFLKAIVASPPGTASPSPIEQYVGAHPAALKFVQAPKPAPSSFAKEAFYGVNAFKFVNAEGKGTFLRYRVVPDAGEEHLDEAALKDQDPHFLYEELPKRVAEGPVTFKVLAQVAEEGDKVDDATVHWPDSRQVVELGVLKLEGIMENSDKEQKHIIFDPVPRVKGIETSGEPLLEVRAGVYLVSGWERRSAP